jgi:hypothetical protein
VFHQILPRFYSDKARLHRASFHATTKMILMEWIRCVFDSTGPASSLPRSYCSRETVLRLSKLCRKPVKITLCNTSSNCQGCRQATWCGVHAIKCRLAVELNYTGGSLVCPKSITQAPSSHQERTKLCVCIECTKYSHKTARICINFF